MRILIAEDEAAIAKALKALLERNKYAVDMVHNGTDALAYILEVQYDALILDIMMPGMDGVSVLREARAKGIATPALFLTAKAEIEDRVVGLDAGADDYLPKPFATAEFLARVRALTRRRGDCMPAQREMMLRTPPDYPFTRDQALARLRELTGDNVLVLRAREAA